MANKLTNDTLAGIKAAQSTPIAKDALDPTFGDRTGDGNGIATSQGGQTAGRPHPAGFMQDLGLVYFDLEAPAKKIYPVLTPLRNSIPRVKGNGGEATRWRAITGINTAKEQMGVGEGKRSRRIATEVREYIASYKGMGLEDSISFEATYADDGFDDVRARATEGLLRSVMIGEEQVILGGNSTLALGKCDEVELVSTAAGSTVDASKSLTVQCVALTQDGYYRSSVTGSGVQFEQSRVSPDGDTATYGAGASQISDAITIAASSISGSVTVKVPHQRGAVAYAWYWGQASADVKLGAITTTTQYKITTEVATGTQTVSAAPGTDQSTNSLVYDGILTQIFDSSNGSYFKALDAGAGLNGGGSGGAIAEFEAALQHFWDQHKMGPDQILVSAEQLNDITKLLMGTDYSNSMFQFSSAGNAGVDGRTMNAGATIGSYLNKYSMGAASMIPIVVHPYLAPGTVVFLSSTLPYPTTNIGQVMAIKTRREYTSIEWPLRTRTYEFGIYFDSVLQHYAPFSMGVITNITKQA